MGKVMVTLTEEQENYILSQIGKLGATKSEAIRTIIIMRMDSDKSG